MEIVKIVLHFMKDQRITAVPLVRVPVGKKKNINTSSINSPNIKVV